MTLMKDKISQMANLLLNSPKLQQLAEQEELMKRDADAKARVKCLGELAQAEAAVQALADRMEEARQDLNRIRQKFKPAEEAALSKLLVLDEELRNAQAKYSSKAVELGERHGEGDLLNALYRLHQLKAEKRAAREDLEHERQIRMPWGVMRQNPKFQEKALVLDTTIVAIDRSEQALRKLAGSAASPHEIGLAVAQVLEAHGLQNTQMLHAEALDR